VEESGAAHAGAAAGCMAFCAEKCVRWAPQPALTRCVSHVAHTQVVLCPEQLLLSKSAPSSVVSSPWAQAVGCMPSPMHTLPKQPQQQAQQDLLSCSYTDNSGVSLIQQHVYQV
jgi:hypothetical protein